MSFCESMDSMEDFGLEEAANLSSWAGSEEPSFITDVQSHKRVRYRKSQKSWSTTIDSEKQEFYQKIKQSININFVDNNRYEARISKLEKELDEQKEQNKLLQEEKSLLQKRIEFLETENNNNLFEIKWVRSSKQNIEELLTEHISQCIILEKQKQQF